MNVTKNALIEALNYLNEYPKSSLKKDDLILELNKMYNENINKLLMIVNYKTYKLLEMLKNSNGKGICIGKEYEEEVQFLEKTLIIEEAIIDNEKNEIYIYFNDNMENRFSKFINSKNEKQIKKNQEMVDLILDIVNTYGIIQVDYELSNMLNDLLEEKIDVDYLIELIDYNIDIRRNTYIPNCDTDLFLVSNNLYNPQEIIDERRKRNLDYKKFTKDELRGNNLESLIKSDDAQKAINLLKDINYEMPESLVKAFILKIMRSAQINVKDFMNVENLNFENIDQANEYLQLMMNLHNNIPHYALYGYSPNELMKNQLEEIKKQEESSRNKKIGRNDPCPCGSGKKYKHCCLNKVVKVDFRNEQYRDCIDKEDAIMFFALRNILLAYTNYKYNINPELEELEDINNSEPEDVKEIRERLWNDTSIINDYIRDNPNNLDAQSLDIISEWNNKKINSKFILYKYEDEYAIFIGEENIYYVKGLRDTIRNIIPEYKLPIFVETVLLPFKEQIIYDSYIIQYSMSFGKGMKDVFDNQYKEFIKSKKVKYKL